MILGEDVVLYRASDGRVAALGGLCPHRWAPLALGRVVGDDLQCPYHGAAFDPEGRWARAPSQTRPPPGLSVRAYPVIERGPCLWIWPGDAQRADERLLPDAASVGIGADGWRMDPGGPVLVEARAQILLENLFDQSHIDFVHPLTLGGSAARSDPHQTETIDAPDRFRVVHRMPPMPTDDGLRALFPEAGDQVAAELHVELLGVGLVNSVGSHTFAVDATGARLRPLGRMNFIHALTPRTATSTHYFSAVTRDFALDSDELSGFLMERNVQVMREDIALLEAIETRLDQAADTRKETTFATDAAAMRIRGRMSRIIEQD
jgi:vanillate O-demethylase monooxygenase subunit